MAMIEVFGSTTSWSLLPIDRVGQKFTSLYETWMGGQYLVQCLVFTLLAVFATDICNNICNNIEPFFLLGN